jgi:hypothetical protein
VAWGSIAGGAVVGWLAGGKFHSGRLKKKLNAKHKEDQKALYKQYYNDVVRGYTCVRACVRAPNC